jgi:hypothetical protein
MVLARERTNVDVLRLANVDHLFRLRRIWTLGLGWWLLEMPP